jgi:hypothetical protein
MIKTTIIPTMKKFIYVPASSDSNNVGGFCLEEITAWDYTPVGHKAYSSAEPKEKSLLKIIIKEESLYFFDNVADNLIYQIENYLQSL